MEGEYLLAEVLNTPAVGPNLLLAKGVDPSDGMFDVVTAGEADRDALEAYLEGRRRGHSRVLKLPVGRGRRVEIEAVSSGVLLHVDGEVRRLRPGKPGRVAVRPHSRGVTFLIP
jgi:diacylglycerol kinase family enzyme